MNNKNQKLELTWIGKDNQPKLEPRILIEDTEKSYGHTPCSSQEGIKHTPNPSPPERVIRACQEGIIKGVYSEGGES